MLLSQSFQYEEVLGIKSGYAWIGKPSMFSHVYFVDGLLIDTGQSLVQKSLLAATQDLAIEQIFITHHHEDHTGNLQVLQDRHQCPAYASELCCQLMKAPPKLSFAQQMTWGNRAPYHSLIPKTDLLKTPNFSFQIIPIPGHAPDMVALYEPTRQWLFSADLYINSYIGYYLRDESIIDQINSTKKILELDFKVMFCGHKPQLENPKQNLEKKLNFLEDFFHEVSAAYQKGYTATEIMTQLKLQEDWPVRLLSGGSLSKLNMVKAVIRDQRR